MIFTDPELPAVFRLPTLPDVAATPEPKFSIPIPKVETSFLTKFKVCGVIVASFTPPLLSKAMT